MKLHFYNNNNNNKNNEDLVFHCSTKTILMFSSTLTKCWDSKSITTEKLNNAELAIILYWFYSFVYLFARQLLGDFPSFIPFTTYYSRWLFVFCIWLCILVLPALVSLFGLTVVILVCDTPFCVQWECVNSAFTPRSINSAVDPVFITMAYKNLIIIVIYHINHFEAIWHTT